MVFRWRRRKEQQRLTQQDLWVKLGESLLPIVDPEQLTENLSSKLCELTNARLILVYLVNELSHPNCLRSMGTLHSENHLPVLPVKGRLVKWFRTNRQALLFNENRDLMIYLEESLHPFCEMGMNFAFPLMSKDCLLGIIFASLHKENLHLEDLAWVQTLGKQVGLAYENALLFKERLHQNELMFRAEQLATMGQFAAGIAHELRNPLTVIRSTVQFLQREFQRDSTQWKLADGIQEEVDRLSGIVQNLLTMAEPAESKMQYMDLAEEIENYLSFIDAQAVKQGVHLELQIASDLPSIEFDPAELRQLLLNLVINGIQAMPGGGVVTVRVATQSHDTSGPANNTTSILLQIIDQGIGIRADVIDKVFEPFFTTKEAGTGLGLAICSNIVQRHGGEIWLKQGEKQGTVVNVMLPCVV